MTVFSIGILVLLAVLGAAYRMFSTPASGLFGMHGNASGAVGLGSSVAWILIRIALLFIMALAGSLIASRGIQLFMCCSGDLAHKDSMKPA